MSSSSPTNVEAPGELLFSGSPVIPSAEVFAEARRRQPAWLRALESAYANFARLPENAGLYADPAGKGASIPQIARLFGLLGIRPVCVLARVLPSAQTKGLERFEQRTPDELLASLVSLQQHDGELNVTTLHHDGRTGHCIRITGYDPQSDTFQYHDPWPQASLLCEENNQAGVRAQPDGTRWRVRKEELARVIVACFVFPAYWLRAEGLGAPMLRDEEFRASEMVRHFHLKALGEVIDAPITRRAYAPGPFGRWIHLETDVRPNGRISSARVLMQQEWVAANLPLAVDLAKSFVFAFAPRGPEEIVYREIASALFGLISDPAAALRLKEADPMQSDVVACVHAFAGSLARASASTELGALTIGGLEIEGVPQLGLEFDLY